MKLLKANAAVAFIWMLASSAMALPILDQSNDPANPANYTAQNNVFGSVMQAETFTVGMSGTLVKLDVRMAGSGFGNTMFVDIRKLSGSQPSNLPADVLATRQILASSVTNNASFVSFEFAVPVTANQQLAFVVYQLGNGGIFSMSSVVQWPSDAYTGGSLWTGGNIPFNGGAWYANGNSGNHWDIGFRTFVENSVVPEPTSIALLMLGIAGIGANRRQKSKQVQ